MKKIVWLAALAATLAGCGGGGGGGAAGTASDAPGSQLQNGPTSATVTVTTRAATAATVLYAARFKLQLPAGVTVAADAATGVPASGALTAADGGALVGALYLAATDNAQGYLEVDVVDGGGFTVGKLATVNCAVTRGTAVTADGFSLSGFSAWDANGAVMNGIGAQLEVKLQ